MLVHAGGLEPPYSLDRHGFARPLGHHDNTRQSLTTYLRANDPRSLLLYPFYQYSSRVFDPGMPFKRPFFSPGSGLVGSIHPGIAVTGFLAYPKPGFRLTQNSGFYWFTLNRDFWRTHNRVFGSPPTSLNLNRGFWLTFNHRVTGGTKRVTAGRGQTTPLLLAPPGIIGFPQPSKPLAATSNGF
jgi:hypothetical protein